MTPDIFIDTLLKKHSLAPSFPFDDWVENPISFYALINFWDELFSVASGRFKVDYAAYGEVERDIDSNIYRVLNNKEKKFLQITANSEGGTFYLIPERMGMDREISIYTLGIVSDLERRRLISFFHIIKYFTHTPILNEEDRERMENLFISKYATNFIFPDYDPFPEIRKG